MSWNQKLYYLMPYVIKCRLAEHFAAKQDYFRFGIHYEKTCRAIRSRNGFSSRQFREYQDIRVREVVRDAARHVPYYRNLFKGLGIQPDDFGGIKDLPFLPVLERSEISKCPEDFLDERLDRSKLFVGQSSGSTGTPVKIYKDSKTFSAWFAYMDERCHAVVGLRRRTNRSVSIGGSPVTKPGRTRPPFWVENRRWKQLYMSSYHLSQRHLEHYVKKMREFRPDYVEGYPASLATVARYIREKGLPPIQMKAAFTTAEKLREEHRAEIQAGFACRTFDQYGTGENALFFAECKHHNMHMSPEVAYVEVLDDRDQPVAEKGAMGHLISTGLINTCQPLIRYRVGDVAAIHEESRCKCGFATPILGEFIGREDDIVYSVDGRPVSRLSHVPKGISAIREVQIIQLDYGKFEIHVSPLDQETGVPVSSTTELSTKLQSYVGTADVNVRIWPDLPRGPNGKLRTVICKIPAEKRPNADG